MLLTWFPILVTLAVAALVVGGMVTINRLTGPRRPSKIKGALLFVVFDVEVVFLYPWAVELRHLGMFGLVEALVFIGILTVGLVYAWQRGALDWT